LTVISGFRCADGAVLVSDSQISIGTVRRMEQKVWAAPSGFVFALAGAESSMHLLRDRLLATTFAATNQHELRDEIGALAVDVLGKEYARVTAVLGSPSFDHFPAAEAIIGAYLGGPCLYHVNSLATVTMCTGDFVAAGSGGDFAVQAAGVFESLRQRPLTLFQTRLMAFRVVQAAITIAGPNTAIGGPIQLATVGWSGAVPVATLLGSNEQVTVDAVDEWTQLEADRFQLQAPPTP